MVIKSGYGHRYRFPDPLKSGDLIALISPAGPIDERSLLDGKSIIESWGYEVSLGENVLKHSGYLAGSDVERLADLLDALMNPAIKGIICSRGGYGMGRLLPSIPWEKLSRINPKPFVGFSDIAFFMIPLMQKSGWITFSGPQAGKSLTEDSTERTKEHLSGFLSGNHRDLSWSRNSPQQLKQLKGKEGAKGTIIPCCLSILVALIGTEYFPNLNNVILCLEDINEPVYRIDRMFTQLEHTGLFKGLSGLILGHFTSKGKNTSDAVGEIANTLYNKIDFPIWTGLPYGHINDRITIPMGASVEINDESNLKLIQGW